MAEITPSNPFLDLLGVRLVNWAPGRCSWQLDASEMLINPQGKVHGGVIATLMDVSCAYSGIYPENGHLDYRALTLSLNIHYLTSSEPGGLIAKGRLVGGGHRTFFAEAQLLSGSLLIATASGCFRRQSVD
ncbi:PaaI family thioesterase [Halomonas campaniensis]|uniref:Thioesterase domain-containing protein n=1 Tax=Halomonas campaniensis TaxID=213554 RepID=A0A246S413_9GAMM|nr:hypothetical protein JI62_02710 [Halomonas campaniensis]